MGIIEKKSGSNEKNTNENVAAKAGIWYTICNFLFRGMAFITTPIFARIMTKTELGDFSNFASWIAILTVLTSFDLQSSIIRSKLEHDDDMDSYIFSILSLTSVATIIFYGIILLFNEFFVELFQTDLKYIHLMFAYLLATPAYQMLITKHRAYFKYKSFVFLTGITIITSTILSLVLVFLLEDKYAGRVTGNYLPFIVIGICIYFCLAFKGKKIKLKYWKYACKLCIPLVPHVLSLYLLSSSDKIIITNISGSELTAIYSIAYSCYHIATTLFDSMNKAWAPWLLESLHVKKYTQIFEISKKYILIFVVISLGLFIFSPEIIMILGGSQYFSAVYCMPPLIASCVFQFIYTMYVNIEFYEKKTIGVAIATITATSINIILNILIIPISPENGHIIAAYTTLVGYILLFIFHYLLVRKMKMDFVYDIKFIALILVITLGIVLGINWLYVVPVIRYVIDGMYCVALLVSIIKYKSKIGGFLKN